MFPAEAGTETEPEVVYFDQNGPDPGFGLEPGGIYSWEVPGGYDWNSDPSGGPAGIFWAWDADDKIAGFNLLPAEAGEVPTGITVVLESDVSLAGIQVRQAGQNWTSVTLRAETERTIEFAEEAVVSINCIASNRGLIFGDNIVFSGGLIISGAGAGGVQISGVGPQIDGPIFVRTENRQLLGFMIDTEQGTRTGPGTEFVIDSGALLVNTFRGDPATIAGLSGEGGFLRPVVGSHLILEQDSDTEWAGQFGGNAGYLQLTKRGAGTLALTGGVEHLATAPWNIEMGTVLVRATLRGDSPTPAFRKINVEANAAFGGVTTTDKEVVLLYGESELIAGLPPESGILTLEGGLLAEQGAIFNFHMNGAGGNGTDGQSKVVVSGGELLLFASKIAHFFDLGGGSIEADVEYVIFEVGGETAAISGWEDGWTAGTLPAGWSVKAFHATDNQVRVTFESVGR